MPRCTHASGTCGNEARSGSQQLRAVTPASFCCVVRALYHGKAPPWENPPKITVRSIAVLHLLRNAILHLLLCQSFYIFCCCLIPVSSSSESGESPVMSNQEGMTMFICNITGITSTCRQLYLMWALLILVKAPAHLCPVSPSPQRKITTAVAFWAADIMAGSRADMLLPYIHQFH